MASFKLVFLFILFSFLNFAITKAQVSGLSRSSCSGNRTTPNSIFHMQLKTLLSSLSSNANTEFYNNTVAGRNPSVTIYGLFMCRGDVPSQICRQCVSNATERITSGCYLYEEGIIWYDECMVRYSNRYFFSTVDTSFILWSYRKFNISIFNQASFLNIILDTMNKTADEAANNPMGAKKYATKEANISGFQTLFCLAQCTPDLSPQDCRMCLSLLIGKLQQDWKENQPYAVVSPNCNVRYELYPFYHPNHSAPPSVVPSTNPSNTVPNYSDDPVYYNHSCSSNKTFTANRYKELILNNLLPQLSFQATYNTEFYSNGVNDKNSSESAYGHFMCRGDIPLLLCGQCVLNATKRISSECGLSKEAIIWYEQCLLRYSDRNFYGTVDINPRIAMFNTTDIPISTLSQESFFIWLLGDTLNKVASEAAYRSDTYATKSAKINEFQTLYTLVQCTLDLSLYNCSGCLYDLIGSAIPWRSLGSAGGRVLCPKCILRFELFPFYRGGQEAEAPRPASGSTSANPPPPGPRPTDERKGRSRTIILIAVTTVVSVMVFSFGCYFLRKKARKSHKNILKENFGHDSATLESLQFDLAMIEGATNNFSPENRIGKGGFGEVYKGILLDGRHIAVKRLSRRSRQGVVEFRNEVLLIAKLQHRNLVAFIGFCLEEQEKILIYEYMPNKSLDYFLFGTQQQQLLNWSQHYNIIGGIARGILYLHEYSHLKIIHRDLKPSNILLDKNMNPKISDFGMARIIEIDENQGNTNRIVGTYGYMSQEYAMFGQFSEKSDVFSFGVMVLEIITGKKNASSYDSHHIADRLLSYVWRQWRDQTPLSILDPNIKENYSQIEVLKCIQIGLLCVQENPDARPTMVEVVSYLGSSIELPSPQEPAFFLRGRMDPNIVAQESSSSQSVNSSTSFSSNKMSISEFLPR